MTHPLSEQKRFVIRLRSSDYDNGKPDVILEIFHAFLNFLDPENPNISPHKHFLHYQLPQDPPMRHFYIVLDMNYKLGDPDLNSVPFEVFKAKQNL